LKKLKVDILNEIVDEISNMEGEKMQISQTH